MLQRAFWRDVLDRAVRQAFQVLVPFLTIAATAGRIDGVQLRTVATVAATAAVVVILRALSGIRVSTDAPVYLQVLDRAVAAAAGAAAGLVTADGFDLLTADWSAIVLSAALTALTAIANGYLSPATQRDVDLAA
jgi:peptidoglycan/LPS O-acetylase OafA/YrhL